MLHSRNHKQSIEVFHLLRLANAAVELKDFVIPHPARFRRDHLILPAVILENFPPLLLKLPQVRIVGIDSTGIDGIS